MKNSESEITPCVSAGSSSLEPRSLKTFLKDGMTKPKQNDHDGHEHEEHDARIHHGATHLAFELHVLFVVDREPIEDGIEDAAHLAGLNQIGVECIEYLGVALAANR